MAKREPEQKKVGVFKILIASLLIVLCGIAFGAWFYIHLDYQDHSHASYDGYRVSMADSSFFEKNFANKEDELQDGERVNQNFSEIQVNRWAKNEGTNYPAARPVFRIVNQDNKQTKYRISADLSSVKHIKKVEFPTFGQADGPKDVQIYQGSYDRLSNMWQSEILVKNHKEAGLYQVKLLITRENEQTELVDFGEFFVNQPSIETIIDPSLVGKGQFDVNSTVNSKADTETLTVDVWSKDDKHDLKTYESYKQPDGTYKSHIDYEDFDFNNGTYHAEAHFVAANGLKAESNGGTAEIELRRPVRIRVLQETMLFQDRKLSKKVESMPANSVAYIKGIVFNEDQKIYRAANGYIHAENVEISEMMDDIRYVSHRGNRQVAPENSLPAFQQSDSWGTETDIWLTKDKHWVIMHDKTVDRMTNGTGKVTDLTLAQIKELRIDQGANKEKYTDDQLRVPTLEEYLTVMKDKQSVPFIEMKQKNLAPSEFDSLINLIASYGLADTAVIISFDYTNLVEIKKRLPSIQVQLLAKTLTDQMIDQVAALGGNSGLDIKYESVLSRADLIAKAQSKGLSVNLWGVPRSEFKKMEALGINNLTTDYD